MVLVNNLKKLSYLVYGLGLTGKSVINFFKKNKFKNFQAWDDNNNNLYKSIRPSNLNESLKHVNYIILSPGVSLNKSKNKKILGKYHDKIITDIDLLFLMKGEFKTIVVTGTNGKSTTCKMINHILKKNKFKTLLGGNIGTPILDLKIKKNYFLIIEASSFQLCHSKFICPDFAFLLNISNDHLDWHGNMENYKNSKFKIFKLQKKNQYSFVNKRLVKSFKKRNLNGKLIVPNLKNYLNIKSQIENSYLNSTINDENMSNLFALAKTLKISDKSLIKSLKSFTGLPHRYEIFLRRKNCIFVNDSKATSFQSTKFALKSSNNIYWILGGQPKKNDKIDIRSFNKKIIKSYIVGKHINFFKKQIHNKIPYHISRSLKNSIINSLKDIKIDKKKNSTILFSPASASFDQYSNFEERGEKFKKLSKLYARKFI